MPLTPDTLIVPVENQVRELDAKLFLAGVAAARGYRVILGSRAYIHFDMGRFPRGIYLAKSARSISNLMFRVTHEIGHRIVAWEEEALVHPPPETFYTLRLSPGTIRYISDFFCWGEENRELLAGYEHLTPTTRLHVTGNPRGDLLRPEFRAYFEPQVEAYRARHGEFVLINTNFNGVNPYIQTVGLFKDAELTRLGQAGSGMSLEFTRGLYHHKLALYRAFLKLIERLAEARPDQTIVVRPHPSEDQAPYLALSQRLGNVETIAEGNVLPWLLAAKALVHNGCTTAVEAYPLDLPILSYMPVVDDLYDYQFQGFPNRLSEVCRDPNELICRLDDPAALLQAQRTPERDRLLEHHVAALDGAFAAERIVEVLTGLEARPGPGTFRRWTGIAQSEMKKQLTLLNMGRRPGNNRLGYHDHRFPEVSVAELEARLERMAGLTGRFGAPSVRQRSRHVFEIG